MLLVALVPFSLASPSTVPTFLWSPHYNKWSCRICGLSDHITRGSSKGFTISSQGGWSHLLCLAEKHQRHADLALVFVGRKRQSSDISSNRCGEPARMK
ncbi:uncharacterized protein LOC116211636 [Punica granatum]|uniref:Uncharacterized protein LOC116211636 n=1 Tax=Punica granatum TaxID=22663 RepID=A0A6P8E9R9_PUNGR|nr:uncharacterized protein LOC116211636 [Punica granatum]